MNSIINTSNKYVMTPLISLSVWIVAILINAVLDIIAIGFFSNSGSMVQAFGLILIFSAMFSLPGIIIFWIVFVLNADKDELFSMLLKTAFITSFLSIMVFIIFLTGFAGHAFWWCLSATLSAMAAVALHHKAINNVLQKQQINQDV